MLGPGAPHAASTDADPGDPAAAAAAHGLREPAGDTPPREARRAEPPALVPDDQGSHDQGSYGEGVPDGEMMPSLAAALANGGAEAHGVAGLDTPGAPDMAVEEFAAAHGPDGSGEEQAEGAAEATSVRDVDDATGTAPPEHADDADEASHLTVAPDTEQGLTGDGARRVSPAPTKLADSEPDEEGLVLAEGESQDEALHGGEASEVAAHTGETVGQLPLLSAALPPAPPSRSDGANGNGRHEDGTRNGSGAGPSQPEADELDEMLNLDTLPPAIAASLARLAGMKRGGQR